jgi:bacillithiol biosynthesis cysteine-adding enzyme BshC
VTFELLATPFAAPPTAPWTAIATTRSVPTDGLLHPAFLAEGRAAARLVQLLGGEALCVTTGQQPGLFLGPLYTVYKALSAVALAEQLERVLHRPVVPVFWVAGDDHDFLESAQAFTLSAAGDVARLALPERAADAPLTPMYREPLGPAVLELLAEFWGTQPPTEFRPAVEAWLARHYVPERTVAGAFASAVADLLGPMGVVVFQPTHPAAKAAMAPHLLRALEQATAVDARLADRAANLTAAGKPAPVPVGEGASLVMLEGAAGRDRLLVEDAAFYLRRSGERFSLAELAGVADRSPERLSPNVLLRPVVEAALLPTVAYVGGPGELAYLPQCAPVYEALGIPPQVPVPRWSGVVLEARTRKVLEKYGIAIDDLRLPEGQLEQRLVRGELPPEAIAALGSLQEALEREYDVLRDAAVAVDPTLRKPVESTRNAALAGVREVEKRLLSHLKQRNDTLVQQLARTRTSLFPLAKPQERILGAPPFLIRYGDGFLTTVLDAVRQWVARP